MGRRDREAAIAASEQTCPRCGAGRDSVQEYCVECGLRLPAVGGHVGAFRRGWLRRVGWYPGDWVWLALLALIAAAAGTGVAVALSEESVGTEGTTIVARGPAALRNVAGSTPTVLPSPPEPAAGATTSGSGDSSTDTTPREANGRLTWPIERRGWTIVLISYPTRTGRAAPLQTASRAASLGLPEVGVLTSSDFPSLHPGYYVVFSGRYSSRADAEAALPSARATGFGGAYARQISR
jgi:hypothetical protein